MIDETRHELISAALDGEHVDVQVLREVLATPDGRAAAAAFLLLRATVAADVIEPRQNERDAVGIVAGTATGLAFAPDASCAGRHRRVGGGPGRRRRVLAWQHVASPGRR